MLKHACHLTNPQPPSLFIYCRFSLPNLRNRSTSVAPQGSVSPRRHNTGLGGSNWMCDRINQIYRDISAQPKGSSAASTISNGSANGKKREKTSFPVPGVGMPWPPLRRGSTLCARQRINEKLSEFFLARRISQSCRYEIVTLRRHI